MTHRDGFPKYSARSACLGPVAVGAGVGGEPVGIGEDMVVVGDRAFEVAQRRQ